MRNNRMTARAYASGTLAAFLAALAFLALSFSGPLRGQTAVAPVSPATVSPTPADARPLTIDRGAARLWQTLRQLRTRASLLMVVAHPDDEDGGMLAYESRGQGARTSLMTLNRGEGGQNAMADDYYDALGLERTEELLAADRYYGVRAVSGRSVVDFGFSKTLEEALAQWGHDRVLADVVRVVRMTRPLVITSVFVGGPSDGHGHHAVAGEMAQEVFDAAGDPNMFPEQIRGRPASLVAAENVCARAHRFPSPKRECSIAPPGNISPCASTITFQEMVDGAPSVNVEIPEGTYRSGPGRHLSADCARRMVAAEIAKWRRRRSLRRPASDALSPLRLAGIPRRDTEKSFFDGVDISLAGIADLAHGAADGIPEGRTRAHQRSVEQALSEFSAAHPKKSRRCSPKACKETNALVAQVQPAVSPEQAKYDVLHELP